MKPLIRLIPLLFIAVAMLAACGGSDNTISGGDSRDTATDGSGDPGTGGGDGTTPTGPVRFGVLEDGVFKEKVIGIGLSTLSAGGRSALKVDIVDADGTPISDPATVSFNSPCLSSGKASTADPSPIIATDGAATTTYIAQGCTGDDAITAVATIADQTLKASGTITVQPASLGAIKFESAEPSVISLKNIGGTESALVTFKVLDRSGNPVADREVDFELSTQVGGLSLSRTSSKTDAAGLATTDVNTGTVPTPVRVIATTTDPVSKETFSTQSSALAVSTGIPDQDSFSLSVEKHNVEAWTIDGVEVEVTIRAADRYNNPVPDGTTVSFITEGGSIDGNCQTTDGACSVTWRSMSPRPEDGRSTILAYAIGEESFIDQNGNGKFDDAESFTDIHEAFLDNNENNSREIDENFIDFNKDHQYNGKDEFFNGILCKTDTAENPRPSLCSPDQYTLNVFASQVIILSGGNPTIQATGVPITWNVKNQIKSVSFVIRDVNDQPMPVGTTISLSTDVGSISGPSKYTVPDTINAASAANTYEFRVAAPDSDDPKDGTLVLTVTSPGGLVTPAIYNVSYQP